jgi:hypothetical protein
VDAWQAIDDEEVEPVESGGPDPDQDIAGTWHPGLRNVPNAQVLQTAQLAEGERFH